MNENNSRVNFMREHHGRLVISIHETTSKDFVQVRLHNALGPDDYVIGPAGVAKWFPPGTIIPRPVSVREEWLPLLLCAAFLAGMLLVGVIHATGIADPANYVEGWNDMTEEQKFDIVEHW